MMNPVVSLHVINKALQCVYLHIHAESKWFIFNCVVTQHRCYSIIYIHLSTDMTDKLSDFFIDDCIE